MYQVFEGDKSADSQGYPNIEGYPAFKNIHETFNNAKLYAILWAYPIDVETAKQNMHQLDIRPNIPFDMSMYEIPVMMVIKSI